MMEEPTVLRITAAHPDGSICLILDEEDHDESDSIILEYRPDRSPNWRRFEPEIRVESVCSLPGTTLEQARFIAMTEDGDLVHVVEDLSRSRIPGAGSYAPDSLGRGDLIWMEPVDGKPTAMGFRAQIYAMASDQTYAPFSGGFPAFEAYPGLAITFLGGTYSPRQKLFYFVGEIAASKPYAKKFAAANAAAGGDQFVETGDFTLYANSGVVLTFDGTKWSLIRMSRKSSFNYVVTDAQGDVFIGATKGILFGFPQSDKGAPILEVVSDGGICGLTVFDGNVVIAGNVELYCFLANGPAVFEPALPTPENDYLLDIEASERRLYAFFGKSIHYYEDGQWHELAVPPELAVLG